MKKQRIGIWAKVKIVADIESDSDSDVLVDEILNQLNFGLIPMQPFSDISDPEITLFIPEMIDITEDDICYSKEIDWKEWASRLEI